MTLAKEIRNLAQKDAFAAAMLAKRGKTYTPLETLLSIYYHILEDLQRLHEGKKTEAHLISEKYGWTEEMTKQERIEIPRQALSFGEQLCDIFLDAIATKDVQKIKEIAQAIETHKFPIPSVDPLREQLLSLKLLHEHGGTRYTLQDIAILVNWPQKDRADGFSGLRKICRELNIPIKPASKLSRK